MNTILFVVLVIGSFFFDDDCHHHCGGGYGYGRNPNLGVMIIIPVILIGAFLLYAYHQSYQEAPPKRVFISDIDGSKDSPTVTKGTPVAQKTAVKTQPAVHKAAAKTHAGAHHQLAQHTK